MHVLFPTAREIWFATIDSYDKSERRDSGMKRSCFLVETSDTRVEQLLGWGCGGIEMEGVAN